MTNQPTTVHSELYQFIAAHFEKWMKTSDELLQVNQLSEQQAQALLRILTTETSGEPSYFLRDSQYQDFYQFDTQLNQLFADLLASCTPLSPLLTPRASTFFARNTAIEATELNTLLKNGYQTSSHKLSTIQLTKIQSEIADCTFINRGIFSKELSGAEIYAKIQNGKIEQHTRKNGDTFWLKDLNQLCQKDYFQKLAFDPYILFMVSQYLGCTPIHVQTNLWFSFPTFQEKNNLSTNAQMFHQDKEFTKFIKVFIYLSDVGENNGPHCYVEGSQIDEAHTYGVTFSDRIPDEDIIRYYAAERLKTLIGPAGTITFGDTACVHKGFPVKSGYRIMLQLEYAASLYLSPICPFSHFAKSASSNLPYPAETVSRLTANYNDAHRAAFLQREVAIRPPEPSIFRKILRLGKRYMQSLK